MNSCMRRSNSRVDWVESGGRLYPKDKAYLFLAKGVLVIAAPRKGLCTPPVPQGGLDSSNLGKKIEINISLLTGFVSDSQRRETSGTHLDLLFMSELVCSFIVPRPKCPVGNPAVKTSIVPLFQFSWISHFRFDLLQQFRPFSEHNHIWLCS